MTNTERYFVVITTINRPSSCTIQLAARLKINGIPIVVVGDRKGPTEYGLDGSTFFNVQDQMQLPYAISRMLPLSHYSRKNLGYLEAIRQGAECIYETDDDNAPLHSWRIRDQAAPCVVAPPKKWFNVYEVFSSEKIWPRGFPLEHIQRSSICWRPSNGPLVEKDAPIQQGIANLSPDVDSIWRFIFDKVIVFDDLPSIYLEPGTWCPFNSQSTWWWKDAFHLLYLPSGCTFRMTDIWRSFVAQRCLWAMGKGVVFHAAEVEQKRNPHSPHDDFRLEVPGFSKNQEITDILSNIDLPPGPQSNREAMVICYKALIKAGIFPKEEMALVNAWLKDIVSLVNL